MLQEISNGKDQRNYTRMQRSNYEKEKGECEIKLIMLKKHVNTESYCDSKSKGNVTIRCDLHYTRINCNDQQINLKEHVSAQTYNERICNRRKLHHEEPFPSSSQSPNHGSNRDKKKTIFLSSGW